MLKYECWRMNADKWKLKNNVCCEWWYDFAWKCSLVLSSLLGCVYWYKWRNLSPITILQLVITLKLVSGPEVMQMSMGSSYHLPSGGPTYLLPFIPQWKNIQDQDIVWSITTYSLDSSWRVSNAWRDISWSSTSFSFCSSPTTACTSSSFCFPPTLPACAPSPSALWLPGYL